MVGQLVFVILVYGFALRLMWLTGASRPPDSSE